jgi:hypothetical protein
MNGKVAFIPRKEFGPGDNVTSFVESVRRELRPFGPDWDFDQNVWDLTSSLKIRGRGNMATRATFFRFSESATVTDVPIAEPVLSFAKAYITFMQDSRPIKSIRTRFYALKAVAFALEQKAQFEIVFVNDSLLNTAALYFQAHYSESLAYRVGQRIEELAAFLRDSRLTLVPLSWKNFIPRPNDAERVGIEFDRRRAEKLPSEAALNALPKIFNLATEPPDVLAVSICAILLSAPDRINEVLRLPLDCETIQPFKGRDCYGLRWWPSKGSAPQIKYIMTTMDEVVKQAIAKIKLLTAPARQIALWYENNPGSLFLSRNLEYLRKQQHLITSDVAKIIGLADEEAAWKWVSQHKIQCELSELIRGRVQVPFRAVERAVLQMLPKGFPILDEETGLKYSDSLIVVRRNEMHSQKGTYNCMIEPISVNRLNYALGGRRDRKSIFDRFAFKELDGRRIEITTHKFRHYLNTLAHIGGMNEIDIAKWSGRINIRDNANYDDRSPQEIRDKIRRVVGDGSIIGPLSSIPKVLVARKDFLALKFPTAHPTLIGHCVHDYSESICTTHRDCICCEEMVCIKGDTEKNEHIRQQLFESVHLLRKAKKDAAAGEREAGRWAEHYTVVVNRLTELSAILKDPDVPEGAVITLRPLANRLNSSPSRLLSSDSSTKKARKGK